MPDDNASSDADIHGVFCSELWYFQAAVASVNYLLLYAFHFIT